MNIEERDQIFIAIEKYMSLIMMEFKEHLGKYKNLYSNVNLNKRRHAAIQRNTFQYSTKWS
jgi:hypothetical protein